MSATLALCAALAPVSAGAVETANGTEAPDLPFEAQSLPGAYLAAKQAQQTGALDDATVYFDQALKLDPDSEILRQDAMLAFLAGGRFAEAIDLANELRDSPTSGKIARIALGIDGLKKGQYDKAIGEFDIVDPSDLDILLLGQLMAWSNLGAGRVDEALLGIDDLDQAPWFQAFNLYQKGLIADVAGRTEVARAAYSSLVDQPILAQSSPDAFLSAAESLGRLEARAGNRDAAVAAIDKGLDLAPSYDPLRILKQRIERQETIDPAIANVQEGGAEVLRILGQTINRGDGQDVALLYFQLAKALAPRNPGILTALAGIAERTEQFDRAIAYYQSIPENSAYRRTADLQIGLDYWYADRKEEAKDHLRRATETYPDDIQAYTALADVLAADKDYAEVTKALDKAIELAAPITDDNWNLFYQRGISYERRDMWDKAEADFKRALELSPDQPQVLNYLGYSWVDQNVNLDEGLDMIRTAVELRPNDGYIIDSLGWAYYRLGRYDEAVDELERAILLSPTDPTINDHLGDAYWHVGREREARFQWERALSGDPKPEPDQIERIRAKLEGGLEAVADEGGSAGSDKPRADAKDDASSEGSAAAPSPLPAATSASGASDAPAEAGTGESGQAN
ncbi:tetratricopeptide repeat protein [Fulvimarina endophytica]|uniref:Tetratricopeptide repeat protein n=1 Tax=Fulvimarina endophytica TaxID=2293836 RepID=A0A371X239_9HYPH|nr:tetratricopeptide repeat protein [Fulvimarina endophytica]RFC63296.1 tetratricopeptide repeat protein [Fulvimarina endophytica]